MIGQTLSHYRVVSKLGAGGMGEVYRAHDPRLERDVALKVLPAETLTDPEARARLLREARAAAGLNHPHICTIYEVGEAEGQAFIAMELVEGQPLSVRLAGGPLPPGEALRYALQLADAVAHAHDRGIVHRDLKSANVVLTGDGRAKVLDFGLAKRVHGEALDEATRSQVSLNQPGAVTGTLAYMAPEQLRGEGADTRSDIWALGVVLYEMASGARPFQGQTGFQLSTGIMSQSPRPLPAQVPVALRAVIDRCLEKEPGQRYQRAGEVRAALEALQSGTVAPWAGWGYRLSKTMPQIKGWPVWAQRLLLAMVIIAVVSTAVGAIYDLVRGFSAGWQSAHQEAVGAQRIESLAVLPVENLTGDPEQQYFAEGMTEELITEFSHLRAFKKVAPRTAVLRYRGTDRPPPAAIARELGVDAIVEASLLQTQGQVRATFRLIRGATEENLWAERYSRSLGEVHALYGEVVGAVARQLELPLSAEEQARLATVRRVNPEAYEAFLKGRLHVGRLTPEHLQTALEYYHLALEKDPGYALGYAGIATVWLSRAHMGFLPPREALPKAQAAIVQALERDAGDAEVQFARAATKLYLEWDWPAAEESFQKTLAMNPNLPDGHMWYSDSLSVLGRRDETLAAIRRGLELDPLSVFLQASAAGRLLRLGRYEEALDLLRRAVAVEPDIELVQRYLWYAHDRKRNFAPALTAAKKFFELKGQPEVAQAMARGFEEGGYTAAMRRAADRLAEIAKRQYVQGTMVAGLYAYAGDTQRALDWLDRAFEHRDTWLTFVHDDPRFLTLHAEPRFRDLLRRLNIPE